MFTEDLQSVETYQDLLDLRNKYNDAILVAVDFENVDHHLGKNKPNGPLDKLSEVGLASIDTRDLRRTFNDSTFLEIAGAIQSRHLIVSKWAWVTPETCPANRGWHQATGKVHVAEPYHCQVAPSKTIPTGTLAMKKISTIIGDMAKWNNSKLQGETASPDDADPLRLVDIFFWDAHLEVSTFNESSIRKHEESPKTKYYDLQKWAPIRYRWKNTAAVRKSQPACQDLLQSLGLANTGIILHNASNDACIELMAFIRMLKFTEKEWNDWVAGEDLPPMQNLVINNGKYYPANQQLGLDVKERMKEMDKLKGD